MDLKSNSAQVVTTDALLYAPAQNHLAATYGRSSLLTTRELEALKYLAAGYSSDEIGRQLYISKQTVDTHRRNIINKLRVPNVTAAVAYALRNKLIA